MWVVSLCAGWVTAATPLTVEDALRLAMEQNADVRAIAARVEQESAAVRIALANVLPRASLLGTYTRYDEDVSLGEQAVVRQDELVGFGELSVSLFEPRALGAYVTDDRALDAARADAERMRQDVGLVVVELYLGVLRARSLETAANEAIKRREDFYKAAEARLARGATDRSEVQRARLSLLDASTARDRALAEAALALEALAVVLQVEPSAITIAERDAGPRRDLLALARQSDLDDRGDIRAQRLLLERDALGRTFAWLTFLPSLELAAGFTKGPPSFRDPDGFSWQIQLRAELPIYDGGARYGLLDLEAANAELHQAELDRRTMEAERQVRAASIRIEQFERQLATAIESRAIAEQYRTDAVRRLEAGIGTLLEVLDAEVQLSTTEALSQTTQHDLWLAQWELVHAAGKIDQAIDREASR